MLWKEWRVVKEKTILNSIDVNLYIVLQLVFW